MTNLTAFEEHRPLLFSIAYRMLGSASDAEDVVQDAWLRYRDAEDVRSPRAFAATIVTRLCLDRLKSARAAREEYVGPWLPEPILTTAAGLAPSRSEGPDVTLQRSESVTLAFLVMLETLSPEERAVFLLREVFDYKHDEIAEMLGLTAANSRQLFHRAKERIRSRGPRSDIAAPASQREVLLRFSEALKDGDARALTDLLTEDVGFWSDGGGKVAAARRPLVGRDAVMALLIGLHRTGVATGAFADASFALREVNGEPALLISASGRLDTVFVLSVTGGRISALRVARNPDKLRYIGRQLQIRTTSVQ
jgi:RNA polymerase sigma-70 factor (TIGR02957 family)